MAELMSDLDSMLIGAGSYKGRTLGSLTEDELRSIGRRGAGSRDQKDLVKAYCLTKIGIAELSKRLPANLTAKYGNRDTADSNKTAPEADDEGPCQMLAVRRTKGGKPRGTFDPGSGKPTVFTTLGPSWFAMPQVDNPFTLRYAALIISFYIGACLLYPPLAELPGTMLGLMLTAIYNRVSATWTIFINSLAAACAQLGFNVWAAFDTWFTGSPASWQKNDDGTPVSEPYPAGKALAYFLFGVFTLNSMSGCMTRCFGPALRI